MKKLIVIFAMVLMSQMVKGQMDTTYIENANNPGTFTMILYSQIDSIGLNGAFFSEKKPDVGYFNVEERIYFDMSIFVNKDLTLTNLAKEYGVFIDEKTGVLAKKNKDNKIIFCQLIK